MSRVAIVGCGVIAPAYAGTLRELGNIELAACVDGLPERAESFATAFGTRVATLEEVLGDDSIDAVVNLTPPQVHAEVIRLGLEAGRAVFSEKPLAIELEVGQALVQLAVDRGLRLGCAPDTFLGVGLQTARAVIDRGDIGEPVAATAAMLQAGPEWWHPDPDFFYKRGAGPLFDMGPYYFTTLVQLLGPARSVTGAARITRAKRPINSDPRRGELIDVETPTHVTSVIEHVSGPITTLVTSFDIADWRPASFEVFGTEGTLSVPDPNTFEGPVMVKRWGEPAFTEVPLVDTSLPQQRGIGLADMLWAQRSGRAHRVSGDLALHVLELMAGTLRASESGERVMITTPYERTPLL
ncbi:MAG: Gfo/Idh/MocA family protein, partial [Microthrixaceae bacterium]